MSAQPVSDLIRKSPLPDMTSLVVHDSGPFYAYAPGEAIHRVGDRDSVPHLWAGLLMPVTDYPQVLDKEMSGPYVAGVSPDGKKTVNRIWASHIIDIIHRPYFPRALHVTALDRRPLVTCDNDFSVCDNMLREFNQMICPYPLGFEEWELPEEARRIKIPEEVREFIAQENVGVLGYRDRCLKDAEAVCGDTEVGLALREAIYQWRGANRIYRKYATDYINKAEQEIEKQGKLQEGKAVYDDYDRKLLWLLGRKEKERQSPQVVVPQMPQTLTMGPDFGAAIGGAIASALAPLQAEIAEMKAKQNANSTRPNTRRKGLASQPAEEQAIEHNDTVEDA